MSREPTGPLFDPLFIEWKKKNSPDDENENDATNRPHRTSTHRSLLENAALEDITDMVEKDLVIRYRQTLHKLQQTFPRMDKEHMYTSTEQIIEDLSFLEDNQGQENILFSERNDLLQQLLELEQNPILRTVIEREQVKLNANLRVLAERAAQERGELRAKYEEYLSQKERERTEREIKHQYRNPDAWTIRSALRDLSADDVENPDERDILLKYQDTLHQLDQKGQELDDNRELWNNIHAGNDEYYLSIKKELDDEAIRISSQLNILDRNLIDLQNDPTLKNVIEREKVKAKERWEQKAEQRRKETEARVRESAERTERELRERYQKSRQETLQKRAQAVQLQKQEQLKKMSEKTSPKKEKQSKVRTKPWTEGFSLVVVASFFIIMQIICYVEIGDQFPLKIQSWEDFGNLFAFNLCGIIGISLVLSYVFLFQEIKLSDLFRHLKKSVPTQVQDNTCTEKRQEPMNALTSKRIAAVISLLLCITLYLTFLTTIFTNKIDTYICYTTKTGECFHSATCKYLNTAYETTVYEASQRYKVCKYCNPCTEQYKTKITDRNYIIPAAISLPISSLAFFILTYKKKRKK